MARFDLSGDADNRERAWRRDALLRRASRDGEELAPDDRARPSSL